jgi:hypothetical protein
MVSCCSKADKRAKRGQGHPRARELATYPAPGQVDRRRSGTPSRDAAICALRRGPQGRERLPDCLFRNVRLYNRNYTCWFGQRQVASRSQRKATSAHRRRAAARGLVRLEVQAPRKDVELVRTVVETLRGEPEKAKVLRSTLEKALVNPGEMTAFDIFGSDLPDEAFAGVFD